MSITRLVQSSMNPVLPVSSPGMVFPHAALPLGWSVTAVIHEGRYAASARQVSVREAPSGRISIMPVRQSAVDRGKARGHRFVVELSRELEDARTAGGLSYAWLGKAVGISGQQAARVCRGQSPGTSIVRIAGLLAAAGLDLSVSVRTYPAGPPVRDAAHLALLARFRARIATSLIWRAEVPV